MAQSLILSVGTDGRFAGMVAAELVRRGASVRGMVHKAENVGKVGARGVAEAVTADLRDRKTLSSALKGVESAFYPFSASPKRRSKCPPLARKSSTGFP